MNLGAVEIYRYQQLSNGAIINKGLYPVNPDAFIAFGNGSLLRSYFERRNPFFVQRMDIHTRHTHFDPEIDWSLWAARYSPNISEQDSLMLLLPPGNKFTLNRFNWVEEVSISQVPVSYPDNQNPGRQIEGDCQQIVFYPFGNKYPGRVTFSDDNHVWEVSAIPVVPKPPKKRFLGIFS